MYSFFTISFVEYGTPSSFTVRSKNRATAKAGFIRFMNSNDLKILTIKEA